MIKVEDIPVVHYGEIFSELERRMALVHGADFNVHYPVYKDEVVSEEEVEDRNFWHFWVDHIDENVQNDSLQILRLDEAEAHVKRHVSAIPSDKWVEPMMIELRLALSEIYNDEQIEQGIPIKYEW